MPLPVPNLDDRRFDDLVSEATERLSNHLPELTQVSPGDPVHCFIDTFAWLTETILYRANLIPERQRRIFLNLLQIPIRPARPARGIVSISSSPTSNALPARLIDGTQLKSKQQSVTTIGELQPSNLELKVLYKQTLTEDDLFKMGLSPQDLHEQYGLRKGETPKPYLPRQFNLTEEPLVLTHSLDNFFYLACMAPAKLRSPIDKVRDNFAGFLLNVGITPADSLPGDMESRPSQRQLRWELMSESAPGKMKFIPLDVVSDSSEGARHAGVVRLRLPNNSVLFQDFVQADPMFNGSYSFPPALDNEDDAHRVVFWIRLSCPEQPDLKLDYMCLNAIDVIAQGLREDVVFARSTGLPDQVHSLPDSNIDASTLELDVEERDRWVRWQQVDFIAGQPNDARVYQLDAQTGHIVFGDSQRGGLRPPFGARIRIARYRFGGGDQSNLPAESITEVVDASSKLVVTQALPLTGGAPAETVEEAEKRIPQFLTHRNRAVSQSDFKLLAESNPINPVAKAHVVPRFLPAMELNASRNDVPGVVSVFVMPPAKVHVDPYPKPTVGLLKDVYNYLSPKIMLGTELYVLSPQFIPIAVSVVVQVTEPENELTILDAIKKSMTEYFWPVGNNQSSGWTMGNPVKANEAAIDVARVDGVKAVNGLNIFSLENEHWKAIPFVNGLTLEDYQLPELVGIRVIVGTSADQAILPEGLLNYSSTDSASGISVPVIPELC